MRPPQGRANSGGDGSTGPHRPLDARRRAEQDLHILSTQDDKPLVYLVLGAAGSGRREVLADLIAEGLEDGAKPTVLLSAKEWPDPSEEKFPDVLRWSMQEDMAVEADLPIGATHIFILFDGRMNPVDQVEGFKNWLTNRGLEVARAICLVNCQLAEKNPKLFAWYEACIHFSDVVLLNNRDGVPNKWVGDFKERFESKFYPCLWEFVRDNKVKNPALILAPVARRMSHVFDEQDWVSIEEDEDEDDLEDGEETEMKPEEDMYLERRNGGRRVHEIPHIEEFLPKAP